MVVPFVAVDVPFCAYIWRSVLRRYNMTADPGQLNNLYSTFKTEPWVVALHDELMKQVKCRGPTCV